MYVQKRIKTVFSYFYLELAIFFGFSSSNVVPVHLLSVAKRLSELKKLENDLKFANEYYSFVLFIMRQFLVIFTKSEKRLMRH